MAGESVRDIKRRIVSVENTKQITKAMEMVAAAKLRRAQMQVTSGRPFASKLREVLGRLTESLTSEEGEATYEHPLLETRDVRKVLYVFITADRGLAGGYNANVSRFFGQILDEEAEAGREVSVIVIGRKGRDYLRKRGVTPIREYVQIGDEINYATAQELADGMMKSFTNGEYDEISIVYSGFVSAATQKPTKSVVLPLTGLIDQAMETSDGSPGDSTEIEDDHEREQEPYIYEPSPQAVFDVLLPRFVTTEVFHVLIESKASEHGARMTAMRSATDNAEEMIDELTLNYNRARQAGITTEISEIVGGAEAIAAD